MENPFQNLNEQIAKQIQSQNNANQPLDLNPRYTKTVINNYRVNNEKSASVLKNTNCAWSARWTTPLNFNPGILEEGIFLTHGLMLSAVDLNSINGNLTIANLSLNRIYAFSAIIERYSSSVATSINLPWSDNIAVVLNGQTIHASTSNTLTNLPLLLLKGENRLTIYIYTSNSNHFTINTELYLFADKWENPNFKTVATKPTALTLSSVTNPLNTTTFNNTISWSGNSDGYTLGYKLYRRGPYWGFGYGTTKQTSFLSGNVTRGSGNYGLPNIQTPQNRDYYFAVSPYSNLYGEGIPALIITGIGVNTRTPRVSRFNVSGYTYQQNNLPVGSLNTGWYYYGISIWGPDTGRETDFAGVVSGLFNPKKSARLTWSLNESYLTGTFNYKPSGFKIYRTQNKGNWTNSRVVTIKGAKVNSWLDTGITTAAFSPKLTTTQTAISGLGINLNWKNQYITGVDGFYVYRNDIGNFSQTNTRIGNINLGQLRANYPFSSAAISGNDDSGHPWYNLKNIGAVPFTSVGGRTAAGLFAVGKRFENLTTLPVDFSTYTQWQINADIRMASAPAVGAPQSVFGALNAKVNPLIRLDVNNNLSLTYYYSGIALSTLANVISLNTWHKVACDLTNGTRNIYVDNVLKVSSARKKEKLSITTFRVGCAPGGGQTLNNGYISNLQVFNLSNNSPNTLISGNPSRSLLSGFFDSGITKIVGVPIMWKCIATVPFPTNSYLDIGVEKNRRYDYAVTAYNSLLIETIKPTN